MCPSPQGISTQAFFSSSLHDKSLQSLKTKSLCRTVRGWQVCFGHLGPAAGRCCDDGAAVFGGLSGLSSRQRGRALRLLTLDVQQRALPCTSNSREHHHVSSCPTNIS